MSNLKCPFCQQELDMNMCGECGCPNAQCKKSVFMFGSEELWQALIDTKKALEQSEICCTEWEKQALDYKAENIALSGELERTRKALDVAVNALKTIKYRNETYNRDDSPDCIDATLALDQIKSLEQITALEQKDVK